MMKKLIPLFLSIWCVSHVQVNAQGSAVPLGSELYPVLERLEISTGLPAPYHSALKYYNRRDVARYALMLDTTASLNLSEKDRRDLVYIFNENNEWLGAAAFATTIGGRKEKSGPERQFTQIEASRADPRYLRSRRPLLKHFYATPANLLEVNDKYFHFRLNPMLNLSAARPSADSQLIFTNLRGLEARGGVDDRIYFYANIVETQARFPGYVNERITRDRAIPGAGYYKSYQSELFDISQGYDFLNAQGYIGFNLTRHVGVQFGYGRHFIGNGYRSLLLSDFANNYLYLKLNWKVWRFHYQNIFAELAVNSDKNTPEGQVIPKKYMAAHHLSYNLRPNLNFGVFEAVVFSRNNGFELNYLNPVILYRTAEQGLNSPDNVLIGFDGHWDIFRHVRLYGQFMLDEFVFRELFIERQGWWANKFGIQGGLQYVNVLGIDHLDLRAEFNLVRPYTYSYSDSAAVYNHYHQPLAHPLGANFQEWLLSIRYQPLPRLLIESRLINMQIGEDDKDVNWGGNLLLPNTTRPGDYGNTVAQGVGARIWLAQFDVSYQLAHHVFADLSYVMRRKDSDDDQRDSNTSWISLGLRVNVGRQRFDF